MSVAIRRAPPMQVADFIEWVERKPAQERWELLDGEPVLMAPQSERHQVIVGNLLALLRAPAKSEACRALPGLALLNDAADDFAPIPDVVVRCGPVGPSGYAKDPVFLAEVLSPSTMDIDRGRKTTFYKSLTSLRLFIVVFQDERRIEVWTRESTGWVLHACGDGDVVKVPLPTVTMSVDDIYDGVSF